MATLGQAVANDIKSRFRSGDFANEVGEKAGQVVMRNIKEQTRMAKDPSGRSFIPLTEWYADFKHEHVGTSKPDLRSGRRFPDGARKPRAMDEFMYEPDGNEISFNFGGYSEAEDYMGDHQEGMNGMPERRFFPEEQDAKSDNQQLLKEEVAGVLADFLNEDRVIRFKEVV